MSGLEFVSQSWLKFNFKPQKVAHQFNWVDVSCRSTLCSRLDLELGALGARQYLTYTTSYTASINTTSPPRPLTRIPPPM